MSFSLRHLVVVALGVCGWRGSTAHPACPASTTADDVVAGVDLHGKVAVVTGGDTGLGYATALALARRGATIVIGNRNVIGGGEAARNITDLTGVTALALPLDLADFESVRRFAESFKHRFGSRLDILVNNAGVAGNERLSKDGFDLTFQIDYLGHFLLTELLLPALRASAPSRVVNVASIAHQIACMKASLPHDCLKDFTDLPPRVQNGSLARNSSTYGIAKFALIQHAAELARRERHAGVVAFSVDPGYAATGITRDVTPAISKMICALQEAPGSSLPAQPCPFSPDQGAAVIAFAATGTHGLVDGAYYDRIYACERTPVQMQGFKTAMQAELYVRSARWVGLGVEAAQYEMMI